MIELTMVIDFYSHIPCGMWLASASFRNARMYFYSHIPCGMWRKQSVSISFCFVFLLTHPVWDVTICKFYVCAFHIISTHTSRVGCDVSLTPSSFLSGISTHTSRVGCDTLTHYKEWGLKISTHTSRVGCDIIDRVFYSRIQHFYSHIPCGMWHMMAACLRR